MSAAELITRPCTLLLRGPSEAIDDFGDAVREAQEVEAVWELQQRSAAESPEGVSDTVWVGFFLPEIPLATVDAIRDPELGSFELDGDPWPVRDPLTEEQSHIEVRVRRASAQEAGS